MKKQLRRCGLATLVISAGATSARADAQESFVPPVQQVDSRGVDLVAGAARVNIPLASFGAGAPPLSAGLALAVTGDGWTDGTNFLQSAGILLGFSLEPKAEENGPYYNDEVGTYTNVVFPSGSGFYQPSAIHNQVNPDGSYYSASIGPTFATRFTAPSNPGMSGLYNSVGTRGEPGTSTSQFPRMDFANGERWTFNRQFATVTQTPPYTVTVSRLRSVVSSRGYAIQFLYMSDVTPTSQNNMGSWLAPRLVTAYNKATVYCDETLLQECTAVSALPSTEIVYNSIAGTVTVREPGSTEGVELTFRKIGNNWTRGIISRRHTAVPGSTINYLSSYDNSGAAYLQRLTDADGQWNYTRFIYLDDSGYVPEMYGSATNPLGGTVEVIGHSLFGQMTLYNNELPASYWVSVSSHPGDYRVYGWMNPQMDSVQLLRDIRNNITEVIRYPVLGSIAPPLTSYRATYPADCMNPRTCNLPTSTTDANNNVTDYTYDATHGGVLTETGPAVNGVRPQTRHSYAQRTAWTSNGAGGYVAGPPMWLRTATSICRTSAATGNPAAPCATAGDEVLTLYDYGPNSGPNNLTLRGQTVTATDGGVTTTLRTCYAYDALGRKISETQPNANLGSCP